MNIQNYISAILISTSLLSCTSSEKKVEEAKENVEEAKDHMNEASEELTQA
jgi:hypothetical protein